MSYEDKIARARTLLEEYNSQVDADSKIDIDNFLKQLKKAGGINEMMLSECTWEELQKCSLPVLLARKVATIFREAPKDQTKDPGYVSERQAAAMNPKYLVEKYDPKNKNAVHDRLAKLTNGKPFLVFNADGSVNVAISQQLLKEVMDGYPAREFYEIAGRPVKVMAIGVDPGKKIVDENPLYPGRALRPNGDCDQMNRSWDGVPVVVRQLLYVAIKDGVIKQFNLDKAHELLDLALTADAEKKLRSRYKPASVKLDELIAAGQAPTLKITLTAETTKPNDPFAVGGHRTY